MLIKCFSSVTPWKPQAFTQFYTQPHSSRLFEIFSKTHSPCLPWKSVRGFCSTDALTTTIMTQVKVGNYTISVSHVVKVDPETTKGIKVPHGSLGSSIEAALQQLGENLDQEGNVEEARKCFEYSSELTSPGELGPQS
ncbi:MAG: hypothetical protein K1000chlam2_00624 [Chlamydiae bacterium]|nr:hypothetical protein [Chlamydiota bacterium]